LGDGSAKAAGRCAVGGVAALAAVAEKLASTPVRTMAMAADILRIRIILSDPFLSR
jgi:hypothetical protein